MKNKYFIPFYCVLLALIASCEKETIERDKVQSVVQDEGIKINKEQKIIDLDKTTARDVITTDTIIFAGLELPEYEVKLQGEGNNIEQIEVGTILNIPQGNKGGILMFVTEVKVDENKSANSPGGLVTLIVKGFQVALDLYMNGENSEIKFSTPANRAKQKLDIPNEIVGNTIDYLGFEIEYKHKNKDFDVNFNSSPEQLCELSFDSNIWESDDKKSYVNFKGSLGIQPALDVYMNYEPEIGKSKNKAFLELLEATLEPDVFLLFKDKNYYLGDLKEFVANFYASIDKDLTISVHLENEFKKDEPRLIPLGRHTIPTVPVSTQIELAIEVDPEASGLVDLVIHDSLEIDVALGVDLNRDIDDVNWYFKSNSETKSGLELSAKVKLTTGVSLILSTEIYVLGIVGPELETRAFFEGKAIMDMSAGTNLSSNFNWQLTADWGVKAAARLNLVAFHIDKATWTVYENEFEERRYNIYTAPDHLAIISGNNQSGNLGQVLSAPVEIGVYDNLDNLIKYLSVPVYFETDNEGSFSDNPAISADGIASMEWTLGPTDETQQMNAYFMVDGNKSNKVQIEGTGIYNGSTGETGTLTYQGKTYKTVTIGGKEWMAENLAYDVGSGCWVYNNDENNVATYGRLYTWEAAKEACPPGWHLPTDDEWKQLEMVIGMSQSEADVAGWRGTNEGAKLKATSGWINNGNGTDDFGFSALPGGYRIYPGNFNGIGFAGYWWSATEYDSLFAWYRQVHYDNTKVYRNPDNRVGGYGFSVRCVRD